MAPARWRCGGCRRARYCCEDCGRAAWPRHWRACAPHVQAAAEADVSAAAIGVREGEGPKHPPLLLLETVKFGRYADTPAARTEFRRMPQAARRALVALVARDAAAEEAALLGAEGVRDVVARFLLYHKGRITAEVNHTQVSSYVAVRTAPARALEGGVTRLALIAAPRASPEAAPAATGTAAHVGYSAAARARRQGAGGEDDHGKVARYERADAPGRHVAYFWNHLGLESFPGLALIDLVGLRKRDFPMTGPPYGMKIQIDVTARARGDGAAPPHDKAVNMREVVLQLADSEVPALFDAIDSGAPARAGPLVLLAALPDAEGSAAHVTVLALVFARAAAAREDHAVAGDGAVLWQLARLLRYRVPLALKSA